MGKLPTIPHTVEQLRRYKAKEDITTAALVALINTFSGRTWEAGHVDDLFDGRRKLTVNEDHIIKRFLLKEYFDYNNS